MSQDVTGWWAERPAPIVANLRKISASLFASQVARADLFATLKAAASAISGVHKQTGVIVAVTQHPLAMFAGPMNVTGTLIATGKKANSIVSGGVIRTGAIAATEQKLATVTSGGVIRTGTITATAKKTVAAATGERLMPTGTITATTKKTSAALSGLIPQHYSDNFNRADGSLGSDWTTRLNDPRIYSNAVRGYGTNPNVASYAYVMASNNHKVSAKFIAGGNILLFIGSGTDVQACARFDNTHADQYTSTDWSGWGGTGRAYSGAITVPDGATVSIERSGSVFTAKVNGVTKSTWTDTDNYVTRDSSHRMVGLGLATDTTSKIDDWTADDI